MKVTLYEFKHALSCPEFARFEREPPKGECPGVARFGMTTGTREIADLTDAQIDEWALACGVHEPEGEHDHRFLSRMVLEGDDDAAALIPVKCLAASHYEGTLKRTTNPREFARGKAWWG